MRAFRIRHIAIAALLLGALGAQAHPDNGYGPSAGCRALPNHAQLKAALQQAVADETSGLDLQMWATVVDRDGIVCAVAFSGADRGAQWPGSRVISAQKANTANAFSLQASSATPKFPNGLALSTANLYAAVQPGGSLFALPESNPVDHDTAYGGHPNAYGTPGDHMVGRRIGGVNVFGGGLALYDADGRLLGGLGVSGDSSCADHNIAWKTRDSLGLDHVPAGVSPTSDDNIIYDLTNTFGHVECAPDATSIAEELPTTHPIG